MYFTEINDGNIYVSSWREQYLIDNSPRSEIHRIRLNRKLKKQGN